MPNQAVLDYAAQALRKQKVLAAAREALSRHKEADLSQLNQQAVAQAGKIPQEQPLDIPSWARGLSSGVMTGMAGLAALPDVAAGAITGEPQRSDTMQTVQEALGAASGAYGKKPGDSDVGYFLGQAGGSFLPSMGNPLVFGAEAAGSQAAAKLGAGASPREAALSGAITGITMGLGFGVAGKAAGALLKGSVAKAVAGTLVGNLSAGESNLVGQNISDVAYGHKTWDEAKKDIKENAGEVAVESAMFAALATGAHAAALTLKNKPLIAKITNDPENQVRVQSEVRARQEPQQAQPIQESSPEAAAASRVLQAPEGRQTVNPKAWRYVEDLVNANNETEFKRAVAKIPKELLPDVYKIQESLAKQAGVKTKQAVEPVPPVDALPTDTSERLALEAQPETKTVLPSEPPPPAVETPPPTPPAPIAEQQQQVQTHWHEKQEPVSASAEGALRLIENPEVVPPPEVVAPVEPPAQEPTVKHRTGTPLQITRAEQEIAHRMRKLGIPKDRILEAVEEIKKKNPDQKDYIFALDSLNDTLTPRVAPRGEEMVLQSDIREPTRVKNVGTLLGEDKTVSSGISYRNEEKVQDQPIDFGEPDPKQPWLVTAEGLAEPRLMRGPDEATVRARAESQGMRVTGIQRRGMVYIPPLVDELVAATGSAIRSHVEGGVSLRELIKRNVPRTTGYLRLLKLQAADRLANSLEEVAYQGSKRNNNDILDFEEEVKGHSVKNLELMAKFVSGRPSAVEAPKAIQLLAARLGMIADRSFHVAQELKVLRVIKGIKQKLLGSGKWYPQIPNEEGKRFLREVAAEGAKSPRVLRLAVEMMNNEKIPKNLRPKTVEQAIRRFLTYHEQNLRGVNPYFERTRVELPEEMVEWNPIKTMPGLITRNALFVEGVREWGVSFEKAKADIVEIGARTNPGVEDRLKRFLGAHFDKRGIVSQESAKLAGLVSNYQSNARLGASFLSTLRNAGQRIGNTVLAEPLATVKALAQYPPFINQLFKSSRALEDRIRRSGATSPLTEISASEQAPGERLTGIALTPFRLVERGNQVTSAIIAGHQLQADVARLARVGPASYRSRLRVITESLVSATGLRDPLDAAERRITRARMDPQELVKAYKKDGRLSDDQINRVMHAFTRDTQFTLTLATERIWYRGHPWVRALTKFKLFGVEQIGMIANHVGREALKGNLGPAVRFGVAMVLTGETYNLIRDLIFGTNRRDQSLGERLGKDFMAGGGIGMLSDLTYGVWGYAAGPIGSTVMNGFEAFNQTVQRPEMALRAVQEFFGKEISVTKQTGAAWDQADKWWFNKTNRFKEYNIARQRAFNWVQGQDSKGTLKEVLLSLARIPSPSSLGPDSLAYRYAAKQIILGDIDDGAAYLADVLKNAENRKTAIDGIKQSADRLSPLGPISQKNMGLFLRTLSSDERQSVLRLQQDWMQDYYRAIKLAVAIDSRRRVTKVE